MYDKEYRAKLYNRTLYNRICVICGESFSTYRENKKCCKSECSHILHEQSKRKDNNKRVIKWRLNPENKKQQYEQHKIWVSNNPEKIKQYRIDNKETHHKCERIWRQNNPHKKLAYNRKRQGIMDINPLPSDILLKERLKLFSGCCYCDSQDNKTVEHLVPISKGGTSAIYNLFGSCLKCNQSKKDRDFLKWYRSQSFYNPIREYEILQNTLAG